MKKEVLLLLVPAVLAAGCTKDNIVDPWSQDGIGGTDNTTVVDGGSEADIENDEEDLVANTTFTTTISVVFSESGDATVSGADGQAVTIDGNRVTIDNRNVTDANGKGVKVKYVLSGTTTDGFFKVYSDNKQAFVLNGVSITNPNGAAINNQGEKRCFVIVNGSNTLADGSSAAYATEDEEDMKAVFFSEGQLIFSGEGSLDVTATNAQGKSGITTDDYIYVLDQPVITVSAGTGAGHGVRGKDYVRIAGGKLDVSTKAAMKKGINSDGFVLVEGGVTTVNVSGGVAYDDEDKEYTGSACVKADNYFGMTGGVLTVTNSGAGGKGIHAGNYEYYTENGGLNNSYISGGTLTVTTTGRESNDVSAKAIKIGFKEGSDRSYVCGGNLIVSGGTTVVNCSGGEGLEAKGNLSITGGELYVSSSSDDAINCQGQLDMTGGYVYAFSSGNDAVDTNGDMVLSGGYMYAICTKGAPEVALDANTEGGCKLYIKNGATLVTYGGLESGFSAEQNVYSMSCTAGNWNALYNGSSFIAAFKAPSNVSSVAVSAPSLSQGYTGVSVGEGLCNGVWAIGGISGGSSVSLTTYSGGSGPGGQGGPGGPGNRW